MPKIVNEVIGAVEGEIKELIDRFGRLISDNITVDKGDSDIFDNADPRDRND